MRKNGMRSAILTIMCLQRYCLATKEEVIEKHLYTRNAQLVKDNEVVDRLLSEDLESFYTRLRNPERVPKAEHVGIFLTQNLTEEERTLLNIRSNNYLNTFNSYYSDSDRNRYVTIDWDMTRIEKSKDPESILSWSEGARGTLALNYRPKGLSDMELNEKRADLMKWIENQKT